MGQNSNNKVNVTINGTTVQLQQGTTAFQDIVAAASQAGVRIAKPSLITVNSAAAAQGSTVNPNSSYIISGGENLTIA